MKKSQWKRKNMNMECEVVCYIRVGTIDSQGLGTSEKKKKYYIILYSIFFFFFFGRLCIDCCSHANVHVDHRDLLPAGWEQVLLILVPHIDSRVKIIDNERPGASTHIILKINVMICIYFVLIWTLALCNLCNIY